MPPEHAARPWPPAPFASKGWSELLNFDLRRLEASVIRTTPFVPQASSDLLLETHRAALDAFGSEDAVVQRAGIRLMILASRLLLGKQPRGGRAADRACKLRRKIFVAGGFEQLLAHKPNNKFSRPAPQGDAQEAQQIRDIESLAGKGLLSQAAGLAKSRGIAPGTQETVDFIQYNRGGHSEGSTALPPEVWAIPSPCGAVDRDVLRFILQRKCPRGKAQGRLGTRTEHLTHSVFRDKVVFEQFAEFVDFLSGGGLLTPMAPSRLRGTPSSPTRLQRSRKRRGPAISVPLTLC